MNKPQLTPIFRLIMTSASWRVAIRAVLNREFASGPIRWHNHRRSHELICEKLTRQPELPAAAEREPAQQWLAIYPRLLGELPQEQKPEGLQGVVVVGLDPDVPELWSGWIQYRDAPKTISSVHIMGPRMPILLADQRFRADDNQRNRSTGQEERGSGWKNTAKPDRKSANRPGPSTDPKAALRFSRQRGVLGKAAQTRLQNACVTLVGCGGMGSAVATQLTMMGIQSIRAIDPDHLGVENIERTFGGTERQLGKAKVETLFEFLNSIRPEIQLAGIAEPADQPAAEIILRERTDLLVCCVDDEACRVRLNRIAKDMAVCLMDVGSSIQRDQRPLAPSATSNETPSHGIHSPNLGSPQERQNESGNELEEHGDIRLLLPGEGCLGCVGGFSNLTLLRRASQSRPVGSLPPRLPVEWYEQRVGSLLPLNLIVASAAVRLWVDLLMGRIQQSVWLRLGWSPAGGIESRMLTVGSQPDCRYCHSK